MDFASYFPVFDRLTKAEQTALLRAAVLRTVKKGTVLHRGQGDCLGLVLVQSGQLRAHIVSEEGREITVYRLFERDMCLFTASCMLRSIQFDITVTAEKDSTVWVVPAEVYQELNAHSAVLANYTNELMGTRFTEVMWLMEQILWQSFDKRLAAFLLEETVLEETDSLSTTHEQIAAHLGTAREVVTRMLKYFQNEGAVQLSRGCITVTDEKKLQDLAG